MTIGTVAQSTSDYELRTALLQFDGQALITDTRTVESELCVNSTPQAPAFSRWEKCGTGDKPPEQSENSEPLSVP